jgi:glycosyltransferase involved in cell wall biosynthesis
MNFNNKNMIFIAWIGYSRRSQLISEKFQMKLYLIYSLNRRYILAPIRYLLQSINTIKTLIKEKPKIVFVQNPPIFASLIVFFYTKIKNAKFIIDSHTGALLAPWWRWSLPFHAFLSRRAVTTIVTNKYLASIVKSWKAKVLIIEDIPTFFQKGEKFSTKGEFNIAVINTFSPDEPMEQILEAASYLPEIFFYITGDTIRAKKEYLKNHSDNVEFTGFLKEDKYIGLLRSVQAVLVLTNNNYTMQRGACEAVSIGKPIITTNWPILKKYFQKGTIFVDNTSKGIEKGILDCKKRRATLENEILLLKNDCWKKWNKNYKNLNGLINEYI